MSLYLAERFGQSKRMAELQRRYARGEISNSQIADEQARRYRGIPLAHLVAALSDIPCIGGIDPTLAMFRERGVDPLLGTVTWSFAAQEFRRRHGFVANSGTEIELSEDGIPTGRVICHCDEHDKLEFLRSCCKANDAELGACLAIGDSRSDVPLFEAVGFSVALNATSQAREAASVAIDTEDLTDVLDLIPWGNCIASRPIGGT